MRRFRGLFLEKNRGADRFLRITSCFGLTAYWQACQYAVNPKHLVMRRKLAMRPWRPLSGRSASHYSACVILPLFTGRSTCKASHLNIG